MKLCRPFYSALQCCGFGLESHLYIRGFHLLPVGYLTGGENNWLCYEVGNTEVVEIVLVWLPGIVVSFCVVVGTQVGVYILCGAVED